MIFAADQRLLLVAAPAFDLPFGGSSIFETLEMLMKHNCNRPSVCRIPTASARLMFGDPLVEAANRGADVIGIVGTTENVEVSAHTD
jgi:hypothetical protein